MDPDAYLENLREDGCLVVDPGASYLFTVLEDGGLAMEFPDSHLVIRLAGPDAFDGLAAAVADARSREAEIEVDDAGLWPDPPAAEPEPVG